MKKIILAGLLVAFATSLAPAPVAAQDTPARAKFLALYYDALDALEDGDFETSLDLKLKYYEEALGLLRAAYAVEARPGVRDDILNTTAEILWTRGRIADRDKQYWVAVGLLADATKSRPDQFKAPADEAYRKAVFARHLASLPNNTVIVDTTSPTSVLTEAISGRVFFNSSPEVKDRVLKGFQAALVGDWPIVRAQFNEALRLEPGSANLKSLAALADSPELRASRRQIREDRGVDMANQQIPQVFSVASLNTHMAYIQNSMIMKALTDILVGLYRAPVA